MAKRKAKSSRGQGVIATAPYPGDKTEDQYRAEDDLRTMERAEEVREDPARHKRALDHGRQRITQIGKVMAKGRTRLTRTRMRGRR